MPETLPNGEVHDATDHQDDNQDRKTSSPPRSSPRPSTPPDPSRSEDGPPLKRRKLADSSTSPKQPLRPVSPPWKRITAEGPTSFIEHGRRKSGRTNLVPLELQPPTKKRQTRAAFDKAAGDHDRAIRPSYSVGKKKAPSTSQILPSPPARITAADTTPEKKRGPGRPPKIRPTNVVPIRKTETESSLKKDKLAKQDLVPSKPPGRPRKHSTSLQQQSDSAGKDSKLKKENVISRLEIYDTESDTPSPTSGPSRSPSPPLRLQKVTFRVHLPKAHVATPANIPPPKRYPTFRDFLEHDETEATGPREELSTSQIHGEATMRWRVRTAQKSGGLLDRRVVRNLPDRQTEPKRQFAHHDHLLAHVHHFRTLLRAETKDHKRRAELIANEAKRYVDQKRSRNKVKTKAEIEQEQMIANRLKWRNVVKDIDKLWMAVQAEINLQRQKEFQERQQAEMKGHLARVLDRTDQMLNKNLGVDTSVVSSDESDENTDGSGDSDDSEQMSGSASDSDTTHSSGDDDAEMTLDELKQKYDKLPDVVDNASEVANDVSVRHERDSISPADSHEDSDTDTEMDSEFDTDESGDVSSGSEGDEEDGSNDDGPGLLSLFSKAEISELVPIEEGVHTMQMEDVQEGQTQALAPNCTTIPEVQLPEETDRTSVEHLDHISHEPQVTLDAVKADDLSATLPPFPPKQAGSSPESPQLEEHGSQEPSTQPSPHTSVTKASELESASSIDAPAEHAETATPSEAKTSVNKIPVPRLLRGTLREYQHEGLEWLANLYSSGRSGILADEMGLGKTIQSISLLAHLAEVHEVWGPHLIVVPTSVMLNWEMEFKKFLPGFKVLTYYGNLEERKAKRRGWMADDVFNVCITSYQLVIQDANSFKRRKWHYMILDEAHNIKNFRSERWQTMMTFNTQARLLLTGTPLQNNLTELWSLLFFLHYGQENEGEDDAFAGLKEWSEWFKKPVESILEQGNQVLDQEDKEQVAKLHKVIRPFLLRRLKADVEKQMPLKYEHVEMCRLSKRQRQLYDGFMSRAQTKETLASGNYLSIINALMQLRKVCNHPDLFETRPINTSFAMPKSIAADYEVRDLLVRRRLLHEKFDKIDLDFLQLAPVSRENMSMLEFIETSRRHAYHQLKALRDNQWRRIDRESIWRGGSRTNVLQSLENIGRKSRLQELDRTMYFEAYRHHQHPVYGRTLLDRLRIGTVYHQLSHLSGNSSLSRTWEDELPIRSLLPVQSLQQRSSSMQPLVEKFACITPSVTANGLNRFVVSENMQHDLRKSFNSAATDPFHTGRMKLSIAFPDKRLLQYDCGKLQRLDKLLRQLQSGGHRALIFTQMTKVLDILEQFLNIHGHRYLRLDGATKIEQRQILTDRFNNDNRILAFILSSRSGGLGINLTGADTVIFYDLDWNPAMDRQCTDRAHRIGQTRDVHIYRFVSEYTIESNILRKANQKQLLDDVVIQEGDFTTDYMNRLTYKDMFDDTLGGDDMAGAAMDRVLGNDRSNTAAFEQAEDKEDIAAANVAAKEVQHADDGDFDEKNAAMTPHADPEQTSGPHGATNVAIAETEVNIDISHHIDEYMIRLQKFLVRDIPLGLSRKQSKPGRKKKHDEHRIRRIR